MRQTNFGVGGGGISWDDFLGGLGRGEGWAYLMLIGLAAGATVALWAGSNMMKKDSRR